MSLLDRFKQDKPPTSRASVGLLSEWDLFWLRRALNLNKRLNLYERLMSYTREGFPVFDSLVKFK